MKALLFSMLLAVVVPADRPIMVWWDEASNKVDGYEVETSPDGVDWLPAGDVSSNGFAVELGAGETVHYRVRAYRLISPSEKIYGPWSEPSEPVVGADATVGKPGPIRILLEVLP